MQISAISRIFSKQRLTVYAFGAVALVFANVSAAGSPAEIRTESSFSGLNGSSPLGGLLVGADGNLYGNTSQGGANGPPFAGFGTIFRLSPAGGLTTMYSFNSSDGSKPVAGLVEVSGGNLFGTTLQGGASGFGVLYRINTNGSFSLLASFNGNNGASPSGRLLLGADGFLYGSTQSGGPGNLGTIFRATTNGLVTTLFSFTQTNGANPYAGVIQGVDGALYGTTVNGGEANEGIVFRLTTNGLFTTLASFRGTNGSLPYGGLVQDSPGFFYGTTAYGGTHNLGTIFRISTNGVLSTIYSFTGTTDGANPWNSLLRARDGLLYGTTILGGTASGSGWGTAFQIRSNGQFAVLAAFSVSSNGISPYGELVQDAAGRLHGTTSSLGLGLKGTVFQLIPAATQIQSSLGGSGINLAWGTWPGLSYQLQYRTNLFQAEWLDLAPVLATSDVMQYTEPVGTAPRWFRIKQTTAP